MMTGLLKINPEVEVDELLDSKEEQEWSISLASGCCIEHIAIICKNEIVNPILEFAWPKLQSQLWTERYSAILGIGAILEGPS